MGDSILDLNYKEFINSNHSTIGVHIVSDPKRFGIVELEGKNIISVEEKPDNPLSNLALIGIYFIKSQQELLKSINYLIKNDIKTKNEFQITDAYGEMIKRGHIFTAFQITDCLDCGIPETLFSTNKKLLSQNNLNSIHTSAKIKESTLTYCTISKNCKVVNSILNNVIMLPGSVVENQKISNQIIGFDQIINKI